MSQGDPYFAGHHTDKHSEELPTWFDVRSSRKVSLGLGIDSTPIIGDGVALSYVQLQPNAEAKKHAHAEEQIAFVLEGEMEFEIGGDRRLLGPGMGVAIPAWVPHAARTFDSHCTEIDIFQPPRQALIELLRAGEEAATE
jgi:quercetin dioxygenase-like cupin family protein